MIIKYRFSINGVSVHPIYKDDLTKTYEKESGQVFFREQLSGSLSLINEDFDWISSQLFNTEFVLLTEKSNDNGLTWVNYITSSFFKTDCKWDSDNKKVELKVNVKDVYTDVLAGLDKEFNLIKLAPEIKPLFIQKRPLLQYYIPGQSSLTCFLSGMSWEQEVNEPVTNANTLAGFSFSLSSHLQRSSVTKSSQNPPTPLIHGEEFVNKFTFTRQNPCEWLSQDGDYKLKYEPYFSDSNHTLYQFGLYRVSTNTKLFGTPGYDTIYTNPIGAQIALTAVGGSGATGQYIIQNFTVNVYSRYLLDVDNIFGQNTTPILSDDIVPNNRNYKYMIGYDVDLCTISNELQSTPTEYGYATEDEYFVRPYDSLFGRMFYALAKPSWVLSSYWFMFSDLDEYFEVGGRKLYTLKDTFPIHSVISVLLNQLTPGLLHEGTNEYSQFLYSDTNPLSFNNFRTFISPKSNVISGEYDQPARKAPATLGQIFDMLFTTFKCKWFIEDNKLKIEHISYFRNGNSYENTQPCDYDITKLLNRKVKKNWNLGTNSWEFNKSEIPERIEFSWMDKVTEAFTGYPIDVISKYVTRGNIQTVNVSQFTSDIDYMLLNPESISNDGFALFAATQTDVILSWPEYFGLYSSGIGYTLPKIDIKKGLYGMNAVLHCEVTVGLLGDAVTIVYYDSANNIISEVNLGVPAVLQSINDYNVVIPNGTTSFAFKSGTASLTVEILSFIVPTSYELPFITMQVEEHKYIMQNGLLSWLKLHPNYYMHDLPAKEVNVNKINAYAIGISRNKQQSISFPSNDDLDIMSLVKTDLGNGQIEKVSVNLSSRMNEITLVYDTE